MGMEYWINRKIGAKKSCSKKTLLQEIKSAWNDGEKKIVPSAFLCKICKISYRIHWVERALTSFLIGMAFAAYFSKEMADLAKRKGPVMGYPVRFLLKTW